MWRYGLNQPCSPEYVDQVVAGEVVPDPKVGRALTTMIGQVPKMEPDHFTEMVNTNIKASAQGCG